MPRKRPSVPNSHLSWWTVRKAGHAISGNGISRPGYSRHNIILRIDVNGCLFPKQPYSRPRRLRRSPRKVFCTALIHPSQKSFIERLQKRTNGLFYFLALIVNWMPCGSEEPRVGKGDSTFRSRWWPYTQKKKKKNKH